MRFRSDGLTNDGALDGRGPLAVAAREALAFARQGWLLLRDTSGPVIPRDVARGDDVVVFLHGLFATAGVLRPLRAAVGRHARVHTAALTYMPGPGVREIARRLGALMAEIRQDARVHLVGHSLGGVVCRYFALEARDRRVAQTISMASPFAGVEGAAWLGFESVRDLQPRSEVLRRIVHHPDAAAIPHLSIIAGADALVDTPRAHALPGGDVIVMEHRGHNTLLFDEAVASAVERRVLSVGPRAAPHPGSRR